MAGSDQYEASRASEQLNSRYPVTDMPADGSYDYILEPNTAREGLIIYNDSDAPVKVGFASAIDNIGVDNLMFKLAPGGSYESGAVVYTGYIMVATVGGTTGSVFATELTK